MFKKLTIDIKLTDWIETIKPTSSREFAYILLWNIFRCLFRIQPCLSRLTRIVNSLDDQRFSLSKESEHKIHGKVLFVQIWVKKIW